MHDAELRRNPVQHLAHAHANGMKCATATAADLTINVEQNVLARQIFEVKSHVRFYSNMVIRRSKFAIFYAGFCVVSACKSRPPDALGRAPIDAFDQHGELPPETA